MCMLCRPPALQITVERRLYDIGSILCSVGLLERIYMKKRWVDRMVVIEWLIGCLVYTAPLLVLVHGTCWSACT